MIAENIGAVVMDDTDLPYPAENYTESESLKTFLQILLQWEVKLTASLWGIEWDEESFEADFDELLTLGEAEGSEFAAWSVSKAIAESMRPGYSVLGELLLERLDDAAKAFSKSLSAVPILAGAVFYLGHPTRAYRLLKLETAAKPKNTRAWLKSAELLALGGHLHESIEQFQSAIEQEAVNNHLYRAYGNILLAAEQHGEAIDSFILINFADYQGEEEDYLIWEAIAAYGKALELDPKDTRALYSRLLQMIYVQEDDKPLWDDFRKLLSLDTKGEYIRDVIESMYELEDVQPGLDELDALLKANPHRIDYHINLAALHLGHENSDAAKPLLEKARSMTTDVYELAEIERLLLAVNDDDFERRFGEAMGILDAGNELPADEVEFLEEVVEKAPHMIQGQLALARAYYFWDEKKDALEVLLDAQETLPDQPEILNLLARILWESDEKETAFQYLNRGLSAYPFNVALLSRTGQYLFENGQYKDSRSYLARAEEIAPRDPYLQAARTFIARKLAENPKLAESIENED
jgi:tetratricopeptide (TPR) repeat protein